MNDSHTYGQLTAFFQKAQIVTESLLIQGPVHVHICIFVCMHDSTHGACARHNVTKKETLSRNVSSIRAKFISSIHAYVLHTQEP